MRLSKPFIFIAFLGILGALYHAWAEGAFATNYGAVSFSSFASFYGIPYWVFGVIWFPAVFAAALWLTKSGRESLPKELLIVLTLGIIFTGYLWFLDIVIIKAFTLVYAVLYGMNYILTALVVVENWSDDVMRGYLYGTVTGGVVGLLFGPYGVAACAIGGGIFGALRNYFVPVRPPVATLSGRGGAG